MEQWHQSEIMKILGLTLNVSDFLAPVLEIRSVKDWQRGGTGNDAVNGGIIAALCDISIGLAGILNLPKGSKGTADLHIIFKKPLHGDRVRVISKPVRIGSIMVAATVTVLDQNDMVCTEAEGRVILIGKLKDQHPA